MAGQTPHGSRDERGRNARPDAAASGKGKLGPGFKGESGNQGDTKAKKMKPESLHKGRADKLGASGMGGLAIDGSARGADIGGRDVRHTSSKR